MTATKYFNFTPYKGYRAQDLAPHRAPKAQTPRTCSHFGKPSQCLALQLVDMSSTNRVLSPTGEKLAITFHGENQFATVEPLQYNNGKIKLYVVLPTLPTLSLPSLCVFRRYTY
jgi:hypothetical protein